MPGRAGVLCLQKQSRHFRRGEYIVLLVSGGVGHRPPRSLPGYLAGSSATTWHMLIADDYHVEASVVNYRAALTMFFFYARRAACARPHVCVGCGAAVPYDSCACLESKVDA